MRFIHRSAPISRRAVVSVKPKITSESGVDGFVGFRRTGRPLSCSIL